VAHGDVHKVGVENGMQDYLIAMKKIDKVADG